MLQSNIGNEWSTVQLVENAHLPVRFSKQNSIMKSREWNVAYLSRDTAHKLRTDETADSTSAYYYHQ